MIIWLTVQNKFNIGSESVYKPDKLLTNPSLSDNFKLTEVIDTSQISSAEILTFTCESIVSKPKVVTPNCADFGTSITNLKWKSWSSTGTEGSGIYKSNDCNPDCSLGRDTEVQVEVSLSGLFSDGIRYFQRYLNFKSVSNYPESHKITGIWDLAQFYLENPEMRSNK